MKLKEKFAEFTKQESWEKENYNAKECEQIADDYAIEFADWININYFQIVGTKTWCKTLSMEKTYNAKELLEIFKKEKGL